MLLNLTHLFEKYNVVVKGVIQVGCHWCEEHDEFVSCGIERFVYIEPCKEAFKIMSEKFVGHLKWVGGGGENMKKQIENGAVKLYRPPQEFSFYRAACGAEEKEAPMYVSHQNQGQSNSLLKPLLHTQQHPEIIFDDAEIVKVVPLDNLPIEKEKYEMLVMDCQGYEGEVLKGATEILKHINIVYTEVNRGSTYENNMLIEGIDELLSDFERVETFWPSPNWTWGDAVYIRK